MKPSIASLLEDDHESLAQLLAELDAELAGPNIARAFELLDLFWARLAVHIRAENLHLFPAIANAPASLLTGKGSLPTIEEAHDLLLRLGSDHDFFMKELAQAIKVMREISGNQQASVKDIEHVGQRLTVIKERLEVPLGVGFTMPAAHRTVDDDLVCVVGSEPGGVEIVKRLLPSREHGEDLIPCHVCR